MSKITIIIADDHPIFRLGLVNLIKKSRLLNLLAETENGLQALEAIDKYKPDVALIDIEMPVLNGLEVCERVKSRENKKTKILILTLFKEADLYKKAIELGAAGFLLKDNAAEELIEAIIKVNKDEFFVSEGIEKKLTKRKSILLRDQNLNDSILKLTSTEKSILLLVAEHKTSREIASMLFVSEKTIENHRYNIVKKLKLESTKNNLLVFALKNKELLENF